MLEDTDDIVDSIRTSGSLSPQEVLDNIKDEKIIKKIKEDQMIKKMKNEITIKKEKNSTDCVGENNSVQKRSETVHHENQGKFRKAGIGYGGGLNNCLFFSCQLKENILGV